MNYQIKTIEDANPIERRGGLFILVHEEETLALYGLEGLNRFHIDLTNHFNVNPENVVAGGLYYFDRAHQRFLKFLSASGRYGSAPIDISCEFAKMMVDYFKTHEVDVNGFLILSDGRTSKRFKN